MNCGKTKVMLALWVGLATTFALLFLLSTLRARAATPAVDSAEERSPGVPRWLESPAAAASPSSARRADTRGSQTSGDDAEACTIAIATGDSTVDGRPVLWKNRDYAQHSDTWQAVLFWHRPTSNVFPISGTLVFSDRFSYVAVSDRGDRTDRGGSRKITETLYYPRMGANERGLALVSAQAHTLEPAVQLTEVSTYSQDITRGIRNGGLNHWILSRCDTITDVQQLLTATNDGGGYNGSYARNTASLIAVIDRFGRAAIFEVDGNSFARENITKEFTTLDERPHSSGPPPGGYSGFDYRTNFSRITFTNPINGFPYFVDVCINTIVDDRVELDCGGIPDGINDLEVGKRVSSVKRWGRVADRMDDGPKDHQYFMQKWVQDDGHRREYYLETVARSIGFAPYLLSSPRYAWTQEKEVGTHLNRFVTVSSVVIVGSKAGDKDEGRLTTMWVALGEPSVAIFVPVFPYAGEPPAVLDDFFLSVNAKRRLVYDYGEDTDSYPVDNIDAESPYSSLRNADHSIDLSALFGGNYYGEGGLQAYNFAIEDWLFKAHSATVGQLREGPITDITPFTLATRQEEWAAWAAEAYVKSDPTVVVSEVNRSFSEDGYISLTHDFTGPTVVEVIAKGSPGSGVWPRMKVWLSDTAGYTTCLTEVGGETEVDCTVVVSPAHATNKAKSKNGYLNVTSRFALYRYRMTYTGRAELHVEIISATTAVTVEIDKVLLRTEPRSVEMYEAERDWDALSDSGVLVGTDCITLTDETGDLDMHHYRWNVPHLWAVPVTVKVVARDAEMDDITSALGLYYSSTTTADWQQLEPTVTLTSVYQVYTFTVTDLGFEGVTKFQIRSGNHSDVEVDKLLVQESLPLRPNTAPTGYFTLNSTFNGPTMTIIATAIVTDPDGDAIASYFWDLGDGKSYCSGNPVVTHTYGITNPSVLILYATDHRGKTTVIPGAISLAKRDEPDPVVTGATLTYTLDVDNETNLNLTGVTIRDPLPAHTRFFTATPDGSVDRHGMVSWTVPSISVGSSISVQLVVTVDRGLPDRTMLTNSGYSVTSTEWLTPITGPDVTTTVHSPALTIAKQALSPVLPGGRLNYTLNVANRGGADATGVIVTDALPANTGFFTASQGGREENGAVTWENLAVASNASLPVTFAVTVPCTLGLTVTNDAYRVVTSTQGISSDLGMPVTTRIGIPVYLPIVMRET